MHNEPDSIKTNMTDSKQTAALQPATPFGSDAHDALEQLQSFVPFKSMDESHLRQVLHHCEVEIFFAGQKIFSKGQNDGKHLYLLSGEIRLEEGGGVGVTISAGQSESLYPLDPAQPRRRHCIAASDTTLLRIDSSYLDKILCWDQAAKYLAVDIAYERDLDEDAEWMLTVLHSNLFYKIPPINIDTIFNKMKPIVTASGDIILRQGEIGDGCYFIKEGSVEVTRSTDEIHAPTFLANLPQGACFGEDALINQALRNATVRMNTNGVLMFLAKSDFIQLLKVELLEQIECSQLIHGLSDGMVCLDVRTADEYELLHIDGAINMPLELLRLQLRNLDNSKTYIICSDQGSRSVAASALLSKKGFRALVLKGGLSAFEKTSPENLKGEALIGGHLAAVLKLELDGKSHGASRLV